MTKHYAEDKNFIYELDIKHLDENREAKKLMQESTNEERL